MLLHRLFRNRQQISGSDIASLIAKHVDEFFRLLGVPSSEQQHKHKEFIESWPYAPHLLQLLEDQVLVATDAQETRDLIRILANLFKSRGENVPILTAADFRLDEDSAGIGALLDSVANQQHRILREKAMRNITSVIDAVPDYATKIPHLQEIIGALWLRSIAVGSLAGAEPAALQVDATRESAIDDNAFQVELTTIVENSFNIHHWGTRLLFREEENPQAKLMACARNDKLFLDGSDLAQLAKEVRYVIGGSADVAKMFRVIALPKSWRSDPWAPLDESEHPDRWDDRLPILVLPEDPDNLNEVLGRWLKEHLQKRRNTIRFLLPRMGSSNAFYDRDLLILSRASMKSQEWSEQNSEYKKLHIKYQGDLREVLKKRFDRFAVLHQWNFVDPSQCKFHVESMRVQGDRIPEAIEGALANDLFIPEDFEGLVLEAANNNASIGKLLRELQEPRPVGKDCIPWLGETSMKERVLKLCAQGKLAINLRGTEYLQALPGEDENTAWIRLRSKLSYTGRQLEEIFLAQPSAMPTTGGATQIAPTHPSPYVGGSFVGGSPSLVPLPDNGPIGVSESTGSGIFETGGMVKHSVSMSTPATSPINLIGKMESWGINPATPVAQITIKIPSANGAQLKELLKKLPDGMIFELSLEKEGN